MIIKSVIIPIQRITFFGYILDSVRFKVFMTEEQILQILNLVLSFLEKQGSNKRIGELASLIGLLVNAFPAILEALLHYRQFERDKIRGLPFFDNDFEAKISLSKSSKLDLLWLKDNIRQKNGKPIQSDPVDIWIQTDASSLGWGRFELPRWSSITAFLGKIRRYEQFPQDTA